MSKSIPWLYQCSMMWLIYVFPSLGGGNVHTSIAVHVIARMNRNKVSNIFDTPDHTGCKIIIAVSKVFEDRISYLFSGDFTKTSASRVFIVNDFSTKKTAALKIERRCWLRLPRWVECGWRCRIAAPATENYKYWSVSSVGKILTYNTKHSRRVFEV